MKNLGQSPKESASHMYPFCLQKTLPFYPKNEKTSQYLSPFSVAGLIGPFPHMVPPCIYSNVFINIEKMLVTNSVNQFLTAASATCPPTDFQCNVTKSCIRKIFVCDGRKDCGNGDESDEAGCGKFCFK